MTDEELRAAWYAADNAMQTELVRLFGNSAGDHRYDAAMTGWSGIAKKHAAEFKRLGALVHASWQRHYAAA